ncbi:unnamed protein product [Trichobilharzia szidati]|nr:unnamed protein product [Trichobilharzia szidati]
MRIALLMPPKKALLYNRYFPDVTLSSTIPSKFHSMLPGTDFIRTLVKYQNSSLLEEDVVVHNDDDDDDVDENPVIIHEAVNTMETSAPRRQFLTRYNPSDDAMGTTNLNEFIPSTELISENEIYTRECDTDFTYFTQDYSGMITGSQGDPLGLQSNLKVITEKIDLPTGLCIKCAPPGRLVSIPEPLYVNGQFSLHQMDLGSAVTVLALNLKKNDNMLNMSTFSGTKSVIALQTGLLNRLTCVVRSPSRITHVQQITETFQLPENTTTTEAEIRTKIDIICSNDLSNYLSAAKVDDNFKFNKILVNVPCSADRYAITSDAVHVFSPGKINARTGLSKKQLHLLQHAMSLCPANGDVVYSTSTLSPGQNQELIQSFIVNSSKMANFALVNMKPLYNLLNSCYSKLGIKVIPIRLPLFDNRDISNKSKSSDICHALLIVPSVTCNYGPTFIAKFKRLT